MVGKGPSLADLTAGDFGPGPVYVLNHAILKVREFDLPNPIYLQQKDGCIPHNVGKETVIPLGCICPSPLFVPPQEPETLIVSAAESSRCARDYPRRIVMDTERDFGIAWNTMSAVVAIHVVRLMGCRSVRMMAFDAYTAMDFRVLEQDGELHEGTRGYLSAARAVARFARRWRLDVQWVRP